MGLGCWAIGGPYHRDGRPMGWGSIDDKASIRAIQTSIEYGISLFDTADLYGCGHSEVVLGKALQMNRKSVVIASKFGYRIDEDSKQCTGKIRLPDEIEGALNNSLQRLQTDYLDVYQLHLRHCPVGLIADIQERLESFVALGKIRSYGWSTDDADHLPAFSPSPFFIGIQQALNVLQGNLVLLSKAEQRNLTVFCRSPLGMGLLTDNWATKDAFATSDLRSRWNLSTGDVPAMVNAVSEIRHILTQDGRTLVQGALAWLWGKSERTIPIPGFRNTEQVLENIGAVDKGPLQAEQMQAIDDLLTRNFPDNPWDLAEV
jgi:aryl-alcohol dehydrogenase-like predicted oxidoreductase